MYLTIETIVAVGPNAYNKGEDGEVKSLIGPNYISQRISSQCQKHSIRKALRDLGHELAVRTTNIEVWRSAVELAQPKTQAERLDLFRRIEALIGRKAKEDKAAIAEMAKYDEAIGSDFEVELDAGAEEGAIKLKKGKLGVTLFTAFPGQIEAVAGGTEADLTLTGDLAMFGRMVPNGKGTINGAFRTAGWLGISELEEQTDFYVAHADNSKGTGAANMGRVSFSGGGLMYGFSTINLDEFKANLSHLSDAELASLVRDAVQGTVMAKPEGGDHNFNAWGGAKYIRVELDKLGNSNVDAFFDAVTSVEEAIEALVETRKGKAEMFGSTGIVAEAAAGRGSLDDMLGKVEADVLAHYGK